MSKELKSHKAIFAMIESGDPCSVSKTYSAARRIQKERRRYKATVKDRKRQMILDAKDHPCTDCGVKYPYYIMDLDHIRGDKVGNVGNVAKIAGFQALKDELAKCEPVCSNCHRERTHGKNADH